MKRSPGSRLFGGVAALLIFGSASRARAETGSPRLRLWLQVPLMGSNVAFDAGSSGRANAPPRTRLLFHFGGLAAAVDVRDLFTAEVGAAILISPVGGEPSVSIRPEIWVRAGVTPVLYRSGSAGESGWLDQLVSVVGYRSLEQSSIVYEDYGLATEHVHAVALDVGAQATYFTSSGFGFAVRLLAGIIVPVARTYESEAQSVDYPPTKLRFAVPLAVDVGCAF